MTACKDGIFAHGTVPITRSLSVGDKCFQLDIIPLVFDLVYLLLGGLG
jgi:hypothetical protein